MEIDLVLYEYIGHFAGEYFWLDFLAHGLAKYLPYGLIILLFFLFLTDFQKYGKPLGWGVGIGMFTRVFIEPLRRIFQRSRPFVALDVQPLIPYPDVAAFPSGHATFFTALSTIVYFYSKKLGIFYYFCTLLIIIARVYVRVHWPLDIIAGAGIGLIIGLIFHKVMELQQESSSS